MNNLPDYRGRKDKNKIYCRDCIFHSDIKNLSNNEPDFCDFGKLDANNIYNNCLHYKRKWWKFIGIEINPEYVKIAEKRIAQAYDKKRQVEIKL